MKGENKGLRRKIKGPKVKEEHLGSQGKIKGADGAKGKNKMHDGDNTV